MADEPDRRKFLKVATCAVGGGLGVVAAVPALRLLGDPAGKTTVSAPTTPLEVGALDRFEIGGDPRRVDVIAPLVKDGWTTARDVVLGSAWIRRLEDRKLEAFSAVCPHLGCAIDFDGKAYLCPCHDSAWDVAGTRQKG